MNDVVNPIAPPAPTFDIPEGMEISDSAKEFARAPMYAGPGVNREPTDAEQVARLAQARDILGDRFLQPKGPAPLTAAERQAIETREALGVRPNAQATDFTISLPGGVDPSASELIANAMSALALAPQLGSYIGTKIGQVGRRLYEMSNDMDRLDYANTEQRKIAEWAANKNWNLEEKQADVKKLLAKIDPQLADIAYHDSELFIRLAMHAEHLRSVKR